MLGGFDELIQINVLEQYVAQKVKNINYYHVSFPTIY